MTVPWDFRSRTWPHSLLGPHFAHSVIAAHNCYVMGEMRSQVTQVSPTPAPAPPPHVNRRPRIATGVAAALPVSLD